MTQGATRYPASAMQVTPDDVGSRVTLRRAVPGGFSDTIGVLVRMTGEYAHVRRSNGEIVRLTVAEIVAGRVIR